MIGDPAAAPPRPDLTFLRRRSRPRPVARPAAPPPPAAAASATAAPAPASANSGVDYSHHRPPHAAPTVAQPPALPSRKVDYTHRGGVAPPAASRAASPGGSLDLSDAAQPAVPPVLAATDPALPGALDLSDAPPQAPSARRRPVPARRALHHPVRVTGGAPHLLTRTAPAATLSRVQSGIGNLAIEAHVPANVGDLRIAAFYDLASAGSSLVGLSLGRRFAPAAGRRPVLVATHEEHGERLGVDLRQIRDLRRMTIVAFSQSGTPLTWGGALVVTTFGGARIELPLDPLYAGTTAVLMSCLNLLDDRVDPRGGELVLRAEMETVAGDLRQAAQAYGYDRIAWRDDRTPVD